MYGGLMSELLETGTIYDRFYHLFFDWPDIIVFTLFFTLAILCANALTFVAATASSQVSGETTKENFARYGLALLPLVMTGFMAYHLYYLINMGVYFPIVLWQTFHFSIFERMVITVQPSWTLFAQQLLVFIGALGTIVISYRLSRGKNAKLTTRRFTEVLPHLVVAIILTAFLLHGMQSFFY
jgi:hypothetical protein